MTSPLRIIDANANRVREALRVLEEAARFIAEDPALAKQFKQMRHDFVGSLPPDHQLITHRDTPGDIGTTLSTDAEQTRTDLQHVIAAAGSRLSEALRVIEEYSKLDDTKSELPTLAVTAERLRYQSYDTVQRLLLVLGSSHAAQWRVCLLLSESLCIYHPWQEVLEQAVSHGVDCVQVREKQRDTGPLLDHVQAVQSVVAGRAKVIVNDRPDVALIAKADGVHLGQTDLPTHKVRRLVGPRLILGVSTSNLDQAKVAKLAGADYCGVGPMFATTTKHKPHLAGPDYLRDYLAGIDLPHLAIGGITPQNLDTLTQAGVKGIAVSAAICSAKDPAQAARALVQQLS